jgi:Glycosyl hydrolase family 1
MQPRDADLTRRDLVRYAATAAIGLSAAQFGGCASVSEECRSETASPDRSSASAAEARQFLNGFYWGAATASPQIEGGWNEDGRGPPGRMGSSIPAREVVRATKGEACSLGEKDVRWRAVLLHASCSERGPVLAEAQTEVSTDCPV